MGDILSSDNPLMLKAYELAVLSKGDFHNRCLAGGRPTAVACIL